MLRIAMTASVIAVMCVFAVASPAGAKAKPSIKVSPKALSIGDTATVTGRGFKAKSTFVLKLDNVKVASGTTNRKGRLRISFTVPQGAAQSIGIEVRCSGRSATTTLQVIDGSPNFNEDSGDLEDDPAGDSEDPDQVPEFSF